MANVWAIKNGDWSDPTVWNTGAVPASVDDVYANNFSVNINQNIDVASLRRTGITGVTAGGTFIFNTGSVTANISNNIFANNFSIIVVSAASGEVVINVPNGILQFSANGNFISHSGNCNLTVVAILLKTLTGSDGAIIQKTSLGNLTINANIEAANVAYNTINCIYLNSNSSTIINGNLLGGTGSNLNSRAVYILSGDLTVNGNILGGSGTLSNNGTLSSSSSGVINVIGNVQGNISRAIVATAGTVNITGNITGSNSNGVPSVDIQGTATLNHIGTAQASAFSSAIVCNTPTQSIVTATGPFLKNGYIVAIASQTLRINFGANSYFQFKKSDGTDIDYVNTVGGYTYPVASDVRDGVSFKSGLEMGTLKVPNPADVRKSIPTDNTVGTADITPEDFITALENSTSDIAVRLRNCATVESTGAQVASYE